MYPTNFVVQDVQENHGHQFPVAEPAPAPPGVQENYNGRGHGAQSPMAEYPGAFPGAWHNPAPPQAVDVPLANALGNLTILHLINPDMRVIMFNNVVPGPDGVFHVWMAIPLNINF